MDSSVRLPRIFVLATCSVCAVLAVTFGLLFVRDYKRTRKKYHKDDNVDDSMKPEHENTDLDQTCLVVDPDLEKALEENGHGVFSRGALYSLLNLMRRVEDYSLEKLLTVLLNCSAFSANQNVIRECGGLSQIAGLLGHHNNCVRLKAAQVLSNLAMNERNQEHMKDCISFVLGNLEYHDGAKDEDTVLEHLKLLVNLSTTNVAHGEIMKGAKNIFNLLSHSLSGNIEREVLRLLVNLSCNPNNLERLLELKPLLILQTFMLPDNQTEMILRAVTITANLLSRPHSCTEQEKPSITEHLNILNGELIQLLDHSNEDVQSQAKRALRSIFAFRMINMCNTQHDSF